MIKLDERTRIQLLADYTRLNRILEDCLMGGERTNFIVVKEDYLTPTIVSESVPHQDTRGKFAYFTNIRNAIEQALITGRISSSQRLPDKSPAYLTSLIEPEPTCPKDISAGYEPGNIFG
jgi:hypothetical protein